MKIGDRVAVLDEDLTGRITSIDNQYITIETKDGFPLQFSADELVLISKEFSTSELLNDDMDKILSKKNVPKRKKSQRTKPKERSRPPMVVDLHIHKLVDSEKGMSPHDKLILQSDTAKRQLDFAIQKKIQRVVFIHGVGEGVLKSELEYLFRRYDNVKYYDADYKEYGRGATEVYIFQNLSP